MPWDHKGQLKEVDLGASGTAYYVYDASGERVRKVIENHNIKEERLYLGGYEVYTKTNNGTAETERETLHVNNGSKRIALLDTEKANSGGTGGTTGSSTTLPGSGPGTDLGKTTVRYPSDNHLGSASLELDEKAEIISYEEYRPFGTTSYRSGRTETEVSLKRYKYVGKERDDETGLYYYGARYYADWIGRFVSVDPLQHKYPYYTPYQYAGNKPVTFIDLDGLEEEKPTNSLKFYFNKNWRETEKVELDDNSIKFRIPKPTFKKEGAKQNEYFFLLSAENRFNLTNSPDFQTDFGESILEEYIPINSPMTIQGGDENRPVLGFSRLEKIDYSIKVGEIVSDWKLLHKNPHGSDVFLDSFNYGLSKLFSKIGIDMQTNFGEVIKASQGGGIFDFKNTFRFDADTLYEINGTFYNKNEAGNYYWGQAMAMLGYSWADIELFANEGTQRLNKQRNFDEPWELDAIKDGYVQFLKIKDTYNIDMYSNPNKNKNE